MSKKNFKRKVLNNGVTVIFEKRKGEVVSVGFAVRYGGINESLEEEGIAHFIEHMLYKGTPKRNALQISKDIEKNGGILNGFTSEEVTAYWCKMPREHLRVALNVLSDMIKNPLFDKKELEKERRVIHEEIKLVENNPTMHVYHKIVSCLYKGRLGDPLIGTLKTLDNITPEKMRRVFKEIYTSSNIIISVVGNADFEEICDFGEKNFSNSKSALKTPEVELINKEEQETRKDLTQANIIFAYHVPKAENKKHYAAIILNDILAGGMSSRLFSEIREKRNLAYAIKGGCDINKNFAYNSVYVGCLKERVEEVKKIIIAEIKDVSENLSEKELEEAKKELIGNHKISKEDSQTQMVGLLEAEIDGKPEELYDFEKNIQKVRLEDVKEIASDSIKKNSFFSLLPK